MNEEQLYKDFTDIIDLLKTKNNDKSEYNNITEPIEKNDNLQKPEIIINNKINNKKKRCALSECKNKINNLDLIISNCKCNKQFCSKHRMPENHMCDYLENYKDNEKKFLESTLVKVDFSKLDKL